MKRYKEIEGDLLELHKQGEFDVIGHGCNCKKTMGVGIAGQISLQFPNTYYTDILDSREEYQKLGDYSYCKDDKIINFYTQFNPGADAQYIWLESCFRKINMRMQKVNIKPKLGLPQIGCGIGGLEWSKVRRIIKRELTNFNVTVVIYNK